MIRRETTPGQPGLTVTFPDGLTFWTATDQTDEELEAVAREVRDLQEIGILEEPDEDPDSDGYGWERRALLRVNF